MIRVYHSTLDRTTDRVAPICPGHLPSAVGHTAQLSQELFKCGPDGHEVLGRRYCLIEHTRGGDGVVQTTSVHDAIARGMRAWSVLGHSTCQLCGRLQVVGSEVVHVLV